MQITDALKKILNGESVPTTGQFRTGLGQLFDFITSMVGADTADPTTLQALLGQVAHHGQCRLVKSGANLVLQPFNGNKLMIGGKMRTIPAVGVSLAATGLTAGTKYYAYARMVSGAMALMASVTGHVTDTDTGIEVCADDASLTLVGMFRPIAGPAFQDTAAQRFVRSWFNDPGIVGVNSLSSGVGSSSTSYVELSSSDLRIEFLSWAGEVVLAGYGGQASNNTASATTYAALAFDSLSAETASGCTGFINGISGSGINLGRQLPKSGLPEGYHYVTVVIRCSAGASSFYGGGGAEGWSITLFAKR